MNHEIDHMKKRWLEARSLDKPRPVPVEHLIGKARDRRKDTLLLHYGSIIILGVILILVIGFLYFLFPFQERLSKTGVMLMAGAFAVRILIEIISSIRSLRIDITNDVLKATDETLRFYRFRKEIHAPVAVISVGLYTIGFYLLLPEFSNHLSAWQIALIAAGYVPVASILIRQTGKVISYETRKVTSMVDFQAQLTLNP